MTERMKNMDMTDLLAKHKADGFMIVGNVDNADFYYATNFFVSDKYTYIQTSGSKELLVVSEMEKGRAELESRITDIRTLQDYNYREKLKQRGDPYQAYVDCIAEILQKEGIRKLGVPRDFPYHTAQALKEEGFTIVDMESPFRKLRSLKREDEIGHIRYAQKACEKAMAAAIDLIHRSEIVDGKLLFRGFELTADDVRREIDLALLDSGCEAVGTIVAGGKKAANPHWEGEGPLKPNESIVIDIFPRSKKHRYFADMSRTVLKGEASVELQKMYDAVLAAQKEAIEMIKPGILCSDIHDRVCDVLESHGFKTIRSGSKVGFIHSTGHGVGLEIHEAPFVGTQDIPLEKDNVITIEPGLYYPDQGGIRIEDMLLVTEDGCENLTSLEKRFVI
ncbi:Xaa-Pro peptidase family protein [uncultured Methanomethylovorans sp.]|uniref:M24 family metallopeptidase n=1 Tax=uncultured Methanomethylovorans sp. TaxID=183759 RepID=UPI002636455C|nr:Xaa-Pro peptidase family protein [uncultured Methanomethylovorans sp.]